MCPRRRSSDTFLIEPGDYSFERNGVSRIRGTARRQVRGCRPARRRGAVGSKSGFRSDIKEGTMPSRWWSAAVVGLIAATLPASAGAQTSDIVFGAWSWRSRDPGSRPAGLGGAYVAVADSIRPAAGNPARLAPLPKAELAAGPAHPWARIGDRPPRPAPPAPPRGPGAPPGPGGG